MWVMLMLTGEGHETAGILIYGPFKDYPELRAFADARNIPPLCYVAIVTQKPN